MSIGRALEWLLWTVGGVALFAGAILAVLSFLDFQFDRAGPPHADGMPAIVLFERGEGLSQIAAKLEQAGVIRNRQIFRYGVWRAGAGRALKAGEYGFAPGASMSQVMAMMRDGEVILHKLTVAEGLTAAQVLRLVAADPFLDGTLTAKPSEGSLLPDTYLFTRGEERDALVARMAKAQSDLLAGLWPNRAPNLPVSTPAEAVILASIVEKETGVETERPRVAAVFVNRLKLGMRLQSDPTIIYGISKGEPLGRGIRLSEISAVTPYNTYQIDGLPPTPIANPGRAAIAAVLNPLQTRELYFVADGTGGHAFAASNDEHIRNITRWREVERARAKAANGKP